MALLPYLVVSPQTGQPVGIHYPKYFGFLIFPSDEIFVPAVRKQLINIIPKQPTVCEERSKKIITFPFFSSGLILETFWVNV